MEVKNLIELMEIITGKIAESLVRQQRLNPFVDEYDWETNLQNELETCLRFLEHNLAEAMREGVRA